MADIEALAEKEIAGKNYNFDTPTGAVKMTINAVEVYQSAGRLALWINFVADVPGRIFSSSGNAFLLATPVINRENEEVYWIDASFSRALDNYLWKAMSVFIVDWIVSEVMPKVRYVFTGDLPNIRKLAFEKMNHPILYPDWFSTRRNRQSHSVDHTSQTTS
jgi:hypothetical protein